MYKATVVALALECFLKKMNWWQYIRVTDSFDVLSYAFTEDCPPEAKKEFLVRLTQMEKSVKNKQDKVYRSESPMNAVTRDTTLWEKGTKLFND
jgi:hypothetical protein